MHLTYDATTDVAYLSLRDVSPDEILGPTLFVETLTDGRVVGLEFQKATACLPAELVAAAERSDGQSVQQRLDERVLRRLRRTSRVPGSTPRPTAKMH